MTHELAVRAELVLLLVISGVLGSGERAAGRVGVTTPARPAPLRLRNGLLDPPRVPLLWV